MATLFIPVGIILFRSMYFYQVDSLMFAMVALTLFLSARQVSLFPGRNTRLVMVLEVLSLPIAMAVAIASTDAPYPVLSEDLAGPLLAGIHTPLALDVLRRTGSRLLRNR